MLKEALLDGVYDRFVVQGYGHLDCWMGKDAWKDVYPRVRHHIEACEQGLAAGECTALEMRVNEDEYVEISQ